jgi:hypothetical protein
MEQHIEKGETAHGRRSPGRLEASVGQMIGLADSKPSELVMISSAKVLCTPKAF